jgi:hypothetical protein
MEGITMAVQYDPHDTIRINRAPVLTLWAAVVTERLGFAWEEALTLGRAVAGLNAYAKGKTLGLFTPTRQKIKAKRETMRSEETLTVELLHWAIPAQQTDAGLRALSKDKPISPASVQQYLQSKFGIALEDAYAAMQRLATSRPPDLLAEEAYALYEQFRPAVAAGTQGWGATGTLRLDTIRKMAQEQTAY